MTFDELLLEKFEEVLEKDLQNRSRNDSLRIVNRYITSLEKIRKRIGEQVIEEVRSSLNNS